MCGIAGLISLNKQSDFEYEGVLRNAISSLNLRGPDFQDVEIIDSNVGLAHARLSIIDTSAASNQPMAAYDSRYTIVFNGEIYNYKELQAKLVKEHQETFITNGDTEVILKMYHHYGKDCLKFFNGFFAFAIYDKESASVFIARDRMGIKPLFYAKMDDRIMFASEMKAMMALGVKKELDMVSLQQYFQFNYIPYPNSIFVGVKKLKPGHTITIDKNGDILEEEYYKIPYTGEYKNLSYNAAQKELVSLLETSVQRRLVADVPLGSFLSGGIDSSVIATLAARHVDKLNTFSIGFKDNPYFDETAYANLVAKKINSNHTVFSLSNNDLYESLDDLLDYIDEPFADSSAIPVYILSKKTKEKVTVALSGDGADEMFGGYNKHKAAHLANQDSILNKMVALGAPVWKALPKSRHSKMGNIVRQLERFAEGQKLSGDERYWRWCSFTPESYPKELLKANLSENDQEYKQRKKEVLSIFTGSKDINETLFTDMHLVLVNDMLTKVDLMSMANSLEVRVPFLDHELVNFAFQIPGEFKVNKQGRKMILKDAFRDVLPAELYNRNKMGFEIPLLQWFKTDLKSLILDDLLSDSFIEEQNIFEPQKVKALKKQLFSNNPGEIHAQIWALIVFQKWYKKYMM